ncbi:MAG: hypothetical protein HY842_02820 [Bacteroidetes bacterium]|nr:hypothetical protein [Bacteroidota bacterium]
MKKLHFNLTFLFVFLLVCGHAQDAQNGFTLSIFLKKEKDSSCYEIISGDKKIIITNDIDKDVNLIVGSMNFDVQAKTSKELKYEDYKDDQNKDRIKIVGTEQTHEKITESSLLRIRISDGDEISIGKCEKEVPKPNAGGGGNPSEIQPVYFDFISIYESLVGDQKQEDCYCDLDMFCGKPIDISTTIIYDYALKKFVKPYNWKKFRINAEEDAYIWVINTNPLRHKLEVTATLKMLFTEKQATYEQLITPSTPKADSNEGKADDAGKEAERVKATAKTDTTTAAANFLGEAIGLENALTLFMSHVKEKDAVNLCDLQLSIDGIGNKIRHELDLTGNLADGLQEWKNNAIGKMEKTEAKPTGSQFIAFKESVDKVIAMLGALEAIDFSRSAVTVPINNADLMEFNIVIKEDDKEIHKLTVPKKIFSRGGFKIDFSTGLFKTWLTDYNYILKDTFVITTLPVDTLEKVIYKKDEGDFNIGLGILAHARFRIGEWIDPAITTGFILQTGKNPTIQYLAGVSALLGREQRWVFSVGASMGQVKRLGTGLKEGIPIKSTATNEVPTRDVWETNWFVGISYNF